MEAAVSHVAQTWLLPDLSQSYKLKIATACEFCGITSFEEDA